MWDSDQASRLASFWDESTSISQRAQNPLLGTLIPLWTPRAQAESSHSTHGTGIHSSQVAAFVLQNFGGSQTFCNIGSWLLPKVPQRNGSSQGSQGHPAAGTPKQGGHAQRVGRESCHCRSRSPSLCRALSLPETCPIKPYPAWNQACGEGRAVYPLPSWLLAQQPQRGSPGMMLWPLSALSLCSALQVPQHPPPATIPAVP